MTRELSRRQATILGAVILTGLLLGGWVLWSLDQRRGFGSDAFHVEAGFADIAGIEVGTRVRIQGMDAGEVVSVQPPSLPGQEVKLRLRLRGGLHHLVTADARVQIASESILAGKIVRIVPGNIDAGLVGDGARLAAAPTTELTETVTQATTKLSSVLSEVDGAMQEFRKGQGTVAGISQDLAESSARLSKILGRVELVMEDVNKGKGSLGMLIKDDSLYKELTGTLTEIKSALADVRQSEGTLSKLVKNNDVYAETLQSLHDVRKMVASVKQNSDAIKALPVVRSYVVDAHKELVRPDCQRFCKWIPEEELFEPGKAVLTAKGRQRLDDAAPWLTEHKEVGSEVLVAAFASPTRDGDVALTLTQKQSEAVCEYLRSTHRVHRTGWWWWSTRSVRPLGVGNNPPAVPESQKLPPARIELLVFVPGTSS